MKFKQIMVFFYATMGMVCKHVSGAAVPYHDGFLLIFPHW